MTAYTSAASGDCNVGATWSPSGVPTSADTVSIGAHTITVPNGVTFNPGAMSLTGTGSGTRATIAISAGGQLTLGGAVTMNAWNQITMVGNAILDTNGYAVTYSLDTSSVNHKIVIAGTANSWSKIQGTGEFKFSDGTASPGYFDCQYCTFTQVKFGFGGGYFSGFTYNVRDCVIDGAEYFRCADYMNENTNWTFQRVDIRNSTSTNGNNEAIKLSIHRSNAGGSGVRVLDKVTFYANTTAKTFRIHWLDFEATNIVSVDGYCEHISSQTTAKFTNCFISMSASSAASVGDDWIITVNSCYIYGKRNNAHACEGFGKIHQDGVIELEYPVGTTDAGDAFPIKDGYNLTLQNMLYIDEWGGVTVNALSGVRTSNPTSNHNTLVIDCHDPAYGVLIRNENFGTFGGTVTLQSNLCYVRSNPSLAANIYAINIETAGNDQITTMDNNAYYGFGSNNAYIYRGVTSATKTVGVTSGYGLNDKIGVNPNFVDDARGLAKWQDTQNGGGDAEDAKLSLLNLNGYDSVTKTQIAANASGVSIASIISYVRAGFAPTNSVYRNAGHDGVTIGAIEYTTVGLPQGNINLGLGISL